MKRSLDARRRRMKAGAQQSIVQSLVQREDVRNALLIRASATSRSTRAVLAGLMSNPNKPGIVWLKDATPSLLPGRSRRPGERLSRCDAFARKREELLRRFDVVVVGAHRHLEPEEQETLNAARFVVLSGINRSATQRIHSDLIEDRDYALVTHHASHDGGYSVFRRLHGDRRS